MSSELQPGRALYYPNFSPDPNWLKCSVLYWDHVGRIVPDQVQEEVFKKDPAECEIARMEGLLEALDPKDYKDGAGEQFRTKLKPILSSEDPKHRQWLNRVKQEITTPIHHGKTPTWLHDAKVPVELRGQLQQEGLLKNDGDWLAMPNMVGGLYMSCLAAEMSCRTHTNMLTDQPILSAGSEALLFTGPSQPTARELNDENALLLRLGIRFPSPEAMQTVSMKKLVKFHEKNRVARGEFRAVFDTLLAKAGAAEDRYHLEGILNDQKKVVSEAMRKHQSDLKSLGITALASFLKVSAPSFLTASWLNDFPTLRTALGVVGVALGAAAALVDVRKQHAKLVSDSPWHYAWKVQRSFR